MAQKLIYGIRPVAERLAAGLPIDRVYVRQGALGPALTDLCNQLRHRGVPVRFVPPERLDYWTRHANHQGVVARLAAVETQRLDRLIPMLYEAGRTPLLIWLDGVTDVRNAGAIARTALELGADALLIPLQGGPPLSADMMKTAAGALNHLPVCRIANPERTAELLTHSGIELVACTEKARLPLDQGQFTGPVCLVLGAEDKGIRPSLQRLCSQQVRIPTVGPLGSLNVSVAAGICLYVVQQQRACE